MAELAGPLRIMKIAIQTAKIAYPDYERERGTKWPDVLIPTKPPCAGRSQRDPAGEGPARVGPSEPPDNECCGCVR